MSNLLKFSLVLALVAINAFFVAVEFSLVASDRRRLEAAADAGSRSSRIALRLTKRLSFHLSGAQLGITIASLGLGALAEPLIGTAIAPLLERTLPDWLSRLVTPESIAVAVALVLASTFHMVAGELIPKGVAIAHPEKVARLLAPAARVVNAILAPIIFLFDGLANALVRRLGMEPTDELATIRNLEEVEHLIRSSGEHGSLAAEAAEILTKTVRLEGKIVADALTPRVHVSALEQTATAAELVDLVAETGFTRFPVHDGAIDNIVGVVYLQALFEIPFDQRSSTPVSAMAVEPFFVPESKDLLDVLDDFRHTDARLMVVADEHGGFEGVITLEDVLEEIVGEIDDEYDTAEVLTETSVPGVYVVSGTLNTDEVLDHTGMEIPEGEYETVAGFILAELGRIPSPGDEVVSGRWRLEVIEMDHHRVASIQISGRGQA